MAKTTAKQIRLFEKAVKYYISELGLKDWRISLHSGDIGEGVFAQVEPDYGQKWAAITICESSDCEATDEEIISMALHECIHLTLAPLTMLTRNPTLANPALVDSAVHGILNFIQGIIERKTISVFKV